MPERVTRQNLRDGDKAVVKQLCIASSCWGDVENTYGRKYGELLHNHHACPG